MKVGDSRQPVLADIEAMVQVAMPNATNDQIDAEVKKRFDDAVAKRDNDLFQTGRLYPSLRRRVNGTRVTCGLYINVILNDYVRTILALNRTNDTWSLDPRVSGPSVYANDGTPMGIGNQVSLEFNLIYRWHAAISDRDDKWTQRFTSKVFPGKDMSKLSVNEFRLGLLAWSKTINPDPGKRNLDMGSYCQG